MNIINSGCNSIYKASIAVCRALCKLSDAFEAIGRTVVVSIPRMIINSASANSASARTPSTNIDTDIHTRSCK